MLRKIARALFRLIPVADLRKRRAVWKVLTTLERMKYRRRRIWDSQGGNVLIADLLASGRPAAFAKLGTVECAALRRMESAASRREEPDWGPVGKVLYWNAGVFPPTPHAFKAFCSDFAAALQSLDVVAVWFNWGEERLVHRYAPGAALTRRLALEPYYDVSPWTRGLAGRKVLVLSPFAESIRAQYARRAEVWRAKPDVLPAFNLRTIRVPLSDALVKSPFESWTAALAHLKREMDAVDYDVAIIGAGAFSVPLAAHAKRRGRVGIHLGGVTQILFGVLGRRWEGEPVRRYFNEAWRRPSAEETPPSAATIEDGCYW
jgi:hypothetical protein